MGKLKAAIDIPGGINVVEVGSQTIINLYAPRRVFYPYFFKPEIIDVGASSQSHQNGFGFQADGAAFPGFNLDLFFTAQIADFFD